MLPSRECNEDLVAVTGLAMWLDRCNSGVDGRLYVAVCSGYRRVMDCVRHGRARQLKELEAKASGTAKPASLASKQGPKGLQSS